MLGSPGRVRNAAGRSAWAGDTLAINASMRQYCGATRAASLAAARGDTSAAARPPRGSVPAHTTAMQEQRAERIREALTRAYAPVRLEVVDESHLHVGHAGARDGRGHFRVLIVAADFRGQAPLKRHRGVYAALGSLMETDIHALAIDARAPEE